MFRVKRGDIGGATVVMHQISSSSWNDESLSDTQMGFSFLKAGKNDYFCRLAPFTPVRLGLFLQRPLGELQPMQ